MNYSRIRTALAEHKLNKKNNQCFSPCVHVHGMHFKLNMYFMDECQTTMIDTNINTGFVAP